MQGHLHIRTHTAKFQHMPAGAIHQRTSVARGNNLSYLSFLKLFPLPLSSTLTPLLSAGLPTLAILWLNSLNSAILKSVLPLFSLIFPLFLVIRIYKQIEDKFWYLRHFSFPHRTPPSHTNKNFFMKFFCKAVTLTDLYLKHSTLFSFQF